jgi:iron complex outermembrane receptor protein
MKESARTRNRTRGPSTRSVAAAVAAALVPLALSFDAAAQEAPAEEVSEVVISGDRLDVMQTAPVDSVFGFGKSVQETPRSITTISNELLSKTLITELDDLVALTPGSFTQSFFGVAGSLDVRGTPGENYFRGIKRIDNPGNYPTAIGASDRIDVVRGPASPIYGPSKIGGYLNFVPKSARASTGQYLSEPTAEIGATIGSWDKRVLHAEVGGPAKVGDTSLGYYLYAESENSGSYYANSSTEQSIVQASFDMSISDTWRTEFGGMYQYFKGNQVAGWNRLTQALIDDGTYITGTPRPLDTNGDGYQSANESIAGNIFAFYAPIFGDSVSGLRTTLAGQPNMALLNTGTTHISGSQVLVQEDDTLEDDVTTLYFDLIGEFASGLKIQNKLFFEDLVNDNENAYGFSQFADTYAMEDQLVVSMSKDLGSAIKGGFQLSPSVRYQNFEHGDNFDFEYFDRRDVTLPGTPVDRRGMATRGQENYSQHTIGHFLDAGLAFLADLTLFEKLNLLGGARYDYFKLRSTVLADSNTDAGVDGDDNDHAVSWSASASYDLPFGIRPYVTVARQSTLILGQGGQLPAANVAGGTAVADSKLNEYGVKASLVEGRLFIAVDYFDQERLDYSAQDTVTNNTTGAKGYEAELRWVINPQLTVTGAFTHLVVRNLGTEDTGFQFSFLGAEDLLKLGINPASVYGGVVGSLVSVSDNEKAGIPENIGSLNFMFGFDPWVPGLSATVGVTSVDSVWSGYSKSVKLPSYTLLNAGVRYESGSWSIGFQGKNLTDETYFRSNFPDLFGSSVVLPELPRNFLMTLGYKF